MHVYYVYIPTSCTDFCLNNCYNLHERALKEKSASSCYHLTSHSSLLQDPPVVPSEVAVKTDDVTAASFHLDWSELSLDNTNDPITAYILEYGESCSIAPPRTISLSGEVEEHTVTALKPHTEYYVKVAAENAAGRGPFCEPVLLQTAPDSECTIRRYHIFVYCYLQGTHPVLTVIKHH